MFVKFLKQVYSRKDYNSKRISLRSMRFVLRQTNPFKYRTRFEQEIIGDPVVAGYQARLMADGQSF
jgi:hypothetical protein